LVTLADNTRDERIAAKIRATISEEWRKTGEIVISDAILHPYVLHLRLSRVPKNYHFDLAIPAGYEKSMRDKFALFRAAVHSFWTEWLCDFADANPDCTAFCAEMKLRETETAYYWSDDDAFWVGIFGYFVDSYGKKYTSANGECKQ
jgi:hypothetical protein